MRCRQDNRGFTLVEMMVSIAITAIASVAASTMLVAGIRYTGMIYREVKLQQELIALDRMMELAIGDAVTIKGFCQATAADTPTAMGVELEDNPEKLWLFFEGGNEPDSVSHLFYFTKDGEVSHGLCSTIPEADALPSSGLTPLTEDSENYKVKYDASTGVFTIDLTLQNQKVTKSMKGYWVLRPETGG